MSERIPTVQALTFEQWLVAHGYAGAKLHQRERELLLSCYLEEFRQAPAPGDAASIRAVAPPAFSLKAAAGGVLSLCGVVAGEALTIAAPETCRTRADAADGDGDEVEEPSETEDESGQPRKPPKPRRFSGTAYTGGAMRPYGYGLPVVVDLAGVKIPNQQMPVPRGHDMDRLVGHTTSAEVSAQRIRVEGVISGVGQDADEVMAMADRGFAWQMSIGADPQRMEFIERGIDVKVNGRNFTGPLYVARQIVLGEVSFVPLGADMATSATVAARPELGATTMTVEQWLAARGKTLSALSEADRTALEGQYRAELGLQDSGGTATATVTATPQPSPNAQPNTHNAAAGNHRPDLQVRDSQALQAQVEQELQASLRASREALVRENERVRAIMTLTADHPNIEGEVVDNGQTVRRCIRDFGISAGWTAERLQPVYALAVLRAERAREAPNPVPGGLAYSQQSPQVTEAVIEAAVLQAGNCELFHSDFFTRRQVPQRDAQRVQRELAARYPDQVMQAAHTTFRGRIRLGQTLTAAATIDGYRGPDTLREDDDINRMFYAVNRSMALRAEGASTASIANVLANVLNKFLLTGYMYVEQAWREIAAIRPVKDFKPTKSVSLFSDSMFQPLGADGEIKHASLQDQAFANQAATYARILGISRTSIINDDLGALTTVPMQMGRGAGLKMNDLFWTAFLALASTTADDGNTFWNSTGSPANHGTAPAGQATAGPNYATGGSTVLSSTSLQTAVQLFNRQVDPKGFPLGIDPMILLYPPELDQVARELMNSAFLLASTGSSRQPNTNIWQGRFRPVMSRYLSNANYTGNSTTGWYLLAEPGLMSVIEACFLNGQEMPTVQTSQMEFNRLGIEIRGFFDTGVNAQNFRGGVKMAGA